MAIKPGREGRYAQDDKGRPLLVEGAGDPGKGSSLDSSFTPEHTSIIRSVVSSGRLAKSAFPYLSRFSLAWTTT
ncbi:hypothetical protein PGT21_028447 [Puccinia graminis f. sp. tritici]|uniref:Uncharacterized protein n=1 Tax=Puccinia graminis f. sp. tritici TaxID=56615 RepID=A0A5B0PL67_PUCGR|nr:hypothetical protein PGT21_028447 [Puccinia graminis f. sp. tritici]